MVYKSNLQSVVKDLEKKLGKVKDDNKVIREIATTIRAEIAFRVFNKGIATGKGFIGSYSTKEMLATKSQFTKKSAFKQSMVVTNRITYSSNLKTKKLKASKGGQQKRPLWIKFPKASKAVPVMRLPGGYKQLRSIQGKYSNTVNLQYSGKLKAGWIIQGSNSSYVVGFDSYGAKISEYQEQHFNKLIWNPTSYEKGLITKMINQWVRLQLK
tara:strand:+ start:198 stop:833 length:636 start_codon:yes stop_codon:yes gene_type:complete